MGRECTFHSATRSVFNILQRSPLDQQADSAAQLAAPSQDAPRRWIASRFNVQATTQDGDLVLWNTLLGSMSTFPAPQRERVRALLKRQAFEANSEGLVKYLGERGFLIPADADEFRRFQHSFGQRHYRSDILQLTLLASEDCNFRCGYCYERFARGTMRPWVREAIKKLVSHRLASLRQLTVSWFGGEPLYGFEAIQDLGPYFAEISKEHEINLTSSITTNGYLLTPQVADHLLSWGIRNLQVTIDGVPEDHDRLRPTRTGEATFHVIFDNLRSFTNRSDDFSMILRINFDPRSIQKLEPFLDLLRNIFGNDSRFKLLIRPVGKWGGDNDPNLNVCGEQEARSVTADLVSALLQRGMGNFDDLRRMGRFGAHVCYAARPYHFIVGADGKLMKCTVALDADERNVVGRLTSEGDLDLDADCVSLWSEPAYAAVEKCKSCVILPQCQGISCPYQRIRGADAHCPPLKRELRKNLLWTHEASQTGARTVKLSDTSRHSTVSPSSMPGAHSAVVTGIKGALL
jgi:uncharacterized protein